MTVGLLQKAMDDSKETQFLIDGFPRNQENQENFVKIVGIHVTEQDLGARIAHPSISELRFGNQDVCNTDWNGL